MLQALYTVHLPTAERACRLLVNALCTTCASRSTALACARYVFDTLGRSTTPPRSEVVRACAPQSSRACLHYGLARSCVVLEAPRRWRPFAWACRARVGPRVFLRASTSPAATATLRTSKLRTPARDHLCPSNRAVNKAFRQSQNNQPSTIPRPLTLCLKFQRPHTEVGKAVPVKTPEIARRSSSRPCRPQLCRPLPTCYQT